MQLPDGFTLKSVQEENNPEKVQRLLWRGFDHKGEPPADQAAVWETIQAAPNYRPDTILLWKPQTAITPLIAVCGTSRKTGMGTWNR